MLSLPRDLGFIRGKVNFQEIKSEIIQKKITSLQRLTLSVPTSFRTPYTVLNPSDSLAIPDLREMEHSAP